MLIISPALLVVMFIFYMHICTLNVQILHFAPSLQDRLNASVELCPCVLVSCAAPGNVTFCLTSLTRQSMSSQSTPRTTRTLFSMPVNAKGEFRHPARNGVLW